MRQLNATKSHVFLIEFTIAVLILALGSAISIGLFVKASQVEKLSTITTVAMIQVQSIAEYAKAAETLPALRKTIDTAGGAFDENGISAPSEAEADFLIDASLSEEVRPGGTMAVISLSAVSGNAAPLFSITVKKYFPGEQVMR